MILKPNPANETIDIDFELIENGETSVYLSNSNGEIVKTLINGSLEKGKHSKVLNTKDLTSGTYFITLQTSTIKKSEKIEIVK